ncbi:type VI secretion system tube protein Hcp [Rhizobium sp.]
MPSESLKYYLIIDGLDGGSESEVFANSFELETFDVKATVAGNKPTFSSLRVNFDAGSASDEILALIHAGTALNARIVGVSREDESKILYDLRVGSATLSNLSVYNDGYNQLTVDFTKLSISTTTWDGMTPITETSGWDLNTNSPITAPLTAAVAGNDNGDPTGDTFTRWYIMIDGLDGGVRIAGLQGAFALGEFDFDIGPKGSKNANAMLNASFELSSMSDEVLRLATTGAELKVRVVGIETENPEGGAIYDLRLGSAAFRDVRLSRDGMTNVKIDFTRYSLTTAESDNSRETTGYDRLKDKALTAPLPPPVTVLDDYLADSNQAYYLVVNGMDGGVNAGPYLGAFALEHFEFGIKNNGSILDARAGVTSFRPLELTFQTGSDAQKLLDFMNKEKGPSSIQILADGAGGIARALDIRFSDLVLKEYSLNGANNNSMLLTFGAYTISNKDADGSIETTGWDREKNKELKSPLPEPMPDPTRAAAYGNIVDFYMVIDGIDGGATAAGHENSFEIGGFDINLKNDPNARLGDLIVELDMRMGGVELTKLLAKDKTINSVQITGNDGDGTAYDLRLNNVTISRFQDNRYSDYLSFKFDSYSLSTPDENGVIRTISYDLVTDKTGKSVLAAARPADLDRFNVTTYGEALKHFIVIEGLDGGVRGAGHDFAFELSDYSYKVGKNTDRLTIQVTFEMGSGADELLAKLGKGELINRMEIFGDLDDNPGINPYDLRMANVFISKIQLSPYGPDILTLSVDKYSLSMRDELASGGFSNAKTTGWDFGAGKLLTSALSSATGASEPGYAAPELKYFLYLDDVDGGSRGDGHDGAFEIVEFDLGFSTAIKKGAAGVAQVAPITIIFDAGQGADELMALLSQGKSIGAAQIFGDSFGAGDTFFDLRLSKVVIDEFSQETGSDRISLTFNAFSLTTWRGDEDGLPDMAETFSFNKNGKTGDTPLAGVEIDFL